MHAKMRFKSKFSSLALLRCKSKFEILKPGCIAVQTDFKIFRAWPYSGANWLSKFTSLALLTYTSVRIYLSVFIRNPVLWSGAKLSFLEKISRQSPFPLNFKKYGPSTKWLFCWGLIVIFPFTWLRHFSTRQVFSASHVTGVQKISRSVTAITFARTAFTR